MQITDLKTRLSILEVAEKLGIRPDRYGKALCPFHEDKTPSLQFSKEKDICTCFSANCTAGTMDIIRLTEKKLGLSTHQALLQLSAWAGDLPQVKAVNGNGTTVKSGEELSRIALLTKVFHYFENSLKTAAKAKEYLASRGLKQQTPTEQGIEAGFNSGNFHQRENKNLVASAVKYGLLKPAPSGGYNVFGKNCLVFPLKNKERQITGLYFRETEEKKENKHYYLADRQGLYPEYPNPETKQLIITEAVIDAASLLQCKDKACLVSTTILASYGTNGLTEEHTTAISQLEKLEEVIFFFDGDKSGKEGAQKQAEKIREIKPEAAISIVTTPEGEDTNSLYTSHQEKAAALFEHLLKERKPFSFSKEKLSDENKKDPDQEQKPISQPQQIPLPFAPKALDNTNPHRLVYQSATARYIVQGGIRAELDSLKVTLLIEPLNKQNPFKYRNKLDLYENRQVERAAREAGDCVQRSQKPISARSPTFWKQSGSGSTTNSRRKKRPS